MRLHLHQTVEDDRDESPQRRRYRPESLCRLSSEENDQRARLSDRIRVAGVDESQIRVRGLRQGAGHVRVLLLYGYGTRRRKGADTGDDSKVIRRGLVDRQKEAEDQYAFQNQIMRHYKTHYRQVQA